MHYRINDEIRDAVLKGKSIPYWGSIPTEIVHKSFELVEYINGDLGEYGRFQYKMTLEECERIGIYNNGGISWCFVREWVIPDISEKLGLI